MSNKPVLTIQVDPAAFAFMTYMVQKCPSEIGGLFDIRVLADGTLYVSEESVVQGFLTQEVSSAKVALDPIEVSAFQKARGWHDKAMPIAHYGWWHSHADMGVGWSETDEEFIEDHSCGGFFASICLNKKGASVHRVDTWVGGEDVDSARLVTLESALRLMRVYGEDDLGALSALFDEKVTERPRQPLVQGFGQGFGQGSPGYAQRALWAGGYQGDGGLTSPGAPPHYVCWQCSKGGRECTCAPRGALVLASSLSILRQYREGGKMKGRVRIEVQVQFWRDGQVTISPKKGPVIRGTLTGAVQEGLTQMGFPKKVLARLKGSGLALIAADGRFLVGPPTS